MDVDSRSEVYIITEAAPEQQAPGKTRRYEHYIARLMSAQLSATTLPLLVDSNASGVRRIAASFRASRSVFKRTRRDQALVVLGLGEVHMLLLAVFLVLAQRKVTYDACDSWKLQWYSRRAQMGGLRSFVPIVGGLVQWLAPRRLTVSYISRRDASADTIILGRRKVDIVPPEAAALLSRIPPVSNSGIERVVAAVDLNSYHNRHGFEEIIDIWPAVRAAFPNVTLDLYGKGLSQVDVEGVRVFGWAKDIRDVYAGNSLVYVTNRNGSGVPNKLVEAVASQRPLLVHESLSPLLTTSPWVYTFRKDLSARLVEALKDSSICPSDQLPKLRL